ncbi:four helix bundle protein [Candidatus Bipolaricaulota bacterium]|nr:four helix bundle protein [Candidatus Bipolaricaulota bacterium]
MSEVEGGPGSVRTLEIWHEAVEIVKAVYTLTQSWPKEELYGLTNQARRAAVSIPANLAEGLGRGTPKEVGRFAQISLGSLYELDTLLYLAAQFGYSDQDMIVALRERLTTLAKRISAFITYQENRQ